MRQLTQDDILDLGDYAASRADRRSKMIALKARRRVALGPYAMFMFENWDTMWHQVHEMLYVEQGVQMGRPIDPKSVSAQLRDELAAYNPLIPNGAELVATVMFEIENPDRRDTVLDNLGGVEHSFSLKVGDQDIAGVPETDTERTNEAGRASSVQFLHFPFTADQRDL
ncbi:MAG: DUF3501 family protein, partial [Alphaproteobacteria bacterium]|nr:DUF3501 family protein [Alphaproteobacteria bacterium]